MQLSGPPALRIRGGDPCGGKQTNCAASCPWPIPRQAASIAFCADLRLATGSSSLSAIQYRTKSQSGAPRSMKMGTTRSLSPYDAAAQHALPSANLRRPAISRYASWSAVFPISQGPVNPLDQSRDRRDGTKNSCSAASHSGCFRPERRRVRLAAPTGARHLFTAHQSRSVLFAAFALQLSRVCHAVSTTRNWAHKTRPTAKTTISH